MKLIIELQVKDVKFKEDASFEQILKSLQRRVSNINDLILNSRLNDSNFSSDDPNHPMFFFEDDLKVIGIKRDSEIKYLKFQYIDEAVKWINDNSIDIISICDAGRFSEGVIVLYRCEITKI